MFIHFHFTAPFRYYQNSLTMAPHLVDRCFGVPLHMFYTDVPLQEVAPLFATPAAAAAAAAQVA